MLEKNDSANKILLRVKLDNFIHEYNGILEDLNLLKEKIITDSNIRFKEIAECVSILRKENKHNLKNNNENLCNCRDVDIALELLEEEKNLKNRFKELRIYARKNKFYYEEEINNFIRVFNRYATDTSNGINTNELEKFRNIGYFSPELIDELIELFQKYITCLSNWELLNGEINEILGEQIYNQKVR